MTSAFSKEEIELAKRIYCAHITTTLNKSYQYCWKNFIEKTEPEKIEVYYFECSRKLLESYQADLKAKMLAAVNSMHSK